MERYESLTAELCKKGIAVAGFDLRGHGKNSGDSQVAAFGESRWKESLEDMKLFCQLLEEKFPNVPHTNVPLALLFVHLQVRLVFGPYRAVGQTPRKTWGLIIAPNLYLLEAILRSNLLNLHARSGKR